jgi:hypothetical protein
VVAVSAGIVLVIAGIWVATQVLGGDALDRLGITSGSTETTVTPDPNFSVAPDGKSGSPGLPNGLRDYPPGYKGDAQTYPM